MSFTHNQVLLLWDIDHTLIETRGVGRAAFAAAFEQTTGHALTRMPHITGRTEPEIYTATAALHGLDTPPPFTVFADALSAAYLERLAQLRTQGRAMPGAQHALAHLAHHPAIRQSVLTGNVREVARIKLDAFELASHLDLDSGAYGDDDGYRPALVAIAQSRAARHTTPFDRTNTILIGDSPGDIATARHGGARVIAVAAGGSAPAELAAADTVLTDLTDLHQLDRAITAVLDHSR